MDKDRLIEVTEGGTMHLPPTEFMKSPSGKKLRDQFKNSDLYRKSRPGPPAPPEK